MSFIRSWVYGNALCAKLFAVLCHALHIGIIATSGIAKCGHFVNIYA